MKRLQDLLCSSRITKEDGTHECKKGKAIYREILDQKTDSIGTTFKFGKWSCENCSERDGK